MVHRYSSRNNYIFYNHICYKLINYLDLKNPLKSETIKPYRFQCLLLREFKVNGSRKACLY